MGILLNFAFKALMVGKNVPLTKLCTRTLKLLKNEGYISGKWTTAKSGKTFDVFNPANGQIIGSVPDMNMEDAEGAILAAKKAFSEWKTTTSKERGILLRKWYNLLQDHSEDLANIVTVEAGKPLAESLGEVSYGNSFIDWFAEEARRIHGEVISSPVKSKEMVLIKQPVGVAALITPWNFPHAMITRKAGAALAAGCTCVIKPAEDTPFTALALAELAHKAGIPDGVVNVVTTSRENAPAVGKLFCENPSVAALSFTGSTEVGKLLYKQCSSGVKRIGLELGGNAPFIVFNSADINKAVDGAIASKFRNCGQTCVSANRFIIQEDIFDTFVKKLQDKMIAFKIGNGMEPKTTLGPLINKAQVNKVQQMVKDAVEKGAKVVYGGKLASDVGELFFQPTLLVNITPDMRCYNEEIFGPVVVCIKYGTEEWNHAVVAAVGCDPLWYRDMCFHGDTVLGVFVGQSISTMEIHCLCHRIKDKFQTEKEAVDIGNSTTRGLAGYFYSNDVGQVWRVARQMEVGMVGINEGIISSAEAAFGGIKESGIGREGSHYGIEEYTYVKYLCFGNLV